MGVNMGSGFESYELPGELVDLEDFEYDFEDELEDEREDMGFDLELMDGDFDSAMASCGWGTDEDYGVFSGDNYGDW